jgi:hypothetical protein
VGGHLAARGLQVGARGVSAGAAGEAGAAARAHEETVTRVAVDVPALADQRRAFDYLAPEGTEVGAVVRVPLHGRRVGGWVVSVGISPPEGLRLSRVAKVSGYGPPADIVDLTEWGAWRWAGRRTALLRAGSPPGVVRSLPPRSAWPGGGAAVGPGGLAAG